MASVVTGDHRIAHGNGRVVRGEIDGDFNKLQQLIAAIDLVQSTFTEWRESRSHVPFSFDADTAWIMLELTLAARLRALNRVRDLAVERLVG